MSDDLEAKVRAAVELIEQLGADLPRLAQLDEAGTAPRRRQRSRELAVGARFARCTVMLKQTLAFASLLTLFGCADEPGTSETAAFIASSTAPTLVYSTTRPSETETYPQLPRLQFRIRDSASVASLSGLYTNC